MARFSQSSLGGRDQDLLEEKYMRFWLMHFVMFPTQALDDSSVSTTVPSDTMRHDIPLLV